MPQADTRPVGPGRPHPLVASLRAARTLIPTVVDANHGRLEDDATVMCLDWHGVGHCPRDADTGADLADASAPSRTGRPLLGMTRELLRHPASCRPLAGAAKRGALPLVTASPGHAPAAAAQAQAEKAKSASA
ncbi:hypothetical protein [Streptomyces sp900116325]|uniref:hypothetical protein n=1 Tax=Streptomyces sp. 900116325 TaxID=3154295 RepID=UPI0033C215A8